MTRALMNRTTLAAGVLVLLTVALFASGWMGRDARASDGAGREVVLVARGMAFYLDGAGAPNPTLRFRAGERVRLVLRNEEPGVIHNFAVPAWDLSTRDLAGEGADTLEFLVPGAAGTREYRCVPHAVMMRGTIVVE